MMCLLHLLRKQGLVVIYESTQGILPAVSIISEDYYLYYTHEFLRTPQPLVLIHPIFLAQIGRKKKRCQIYLGQLYLLSQNQNPIQSQPLKPADFELDQIFCTVLSLDTVDMDNLLANMHRLHQNIHFQQLEYIAHHYCKTGYQFQPPKASCASLHMVSYSQWNDCKF